MTVNQNIYGWVVIGSEPNLRQFAFQRVAKCSAKVARFLPVPSSCTSISESLMRGAAEQELLGPRCLAHTRLWGDGLRSLPGPAGHPFCIVSGRHSTG